jgi:3,5-epimerase/4-reductase
MKLLVYGHKGWVGQQFIQLLIKETALTDNVDDMLVFILGKARVDNVLELNKEIDLEKPTNIISFIGRTHGTIDGKEYPTIDYLEQPGKLRENVQDNLFAPLTLALTCNKRNIHYTYLGTGCIFNYLKDNDNDKNNNDIYAFNENDKPNFFGSGYSCVKGFTDRLMHQLEENVLNLRIRMPIIDSDNSRNFITKIVNYEKICSIQNSMSVLPELLPIVLRMITKRVTGTMNLTNPGTISHNEILEMYKEYVDPSFTWINFSIEEQSKVIASERSNNLLDTSLLEKFAPEVRPIKLAVKEVMKKYKQVSLKKVEKVLVEKNFLDITTTIILVTGGAGFIGSNFINELFQQYHGLRVINFDALYYCADEKKNIDEKIRLNKDRYSFINGNLQSYDLLKYIFQTNEITHIVHFAAQSHVQTSFTDALQYTQDNIVGTHNLLEASRLYCPTLQKFVHVSTDEVYGESMLNVDEKHKSEQSVLCPTNPYAATKAAAELLSQSYNHSFKMPIIITRGNNVYGPNQFPEKVIPRFIEQLKHENKKVTIQGDGSCVRAFLHAYDTATAFITILEKGQVGEIYNIGCDEGMEYSILDVAKILIKKIKKTEDYAEWITYIEDRPFNDQRYYISNYKLKKLGWEIKISFLDGINMLVE